MFTDQGRRRLHLTDVRLSIHPGHPMMTPIPIPSQYGLASLHPVPPTLMLPYSMLPRVKHFSRPPQLQGPSICSGTVARLGKKIRRNQWTANSAGRRLNASYFLSTNPTQLRCAVPNASARYLAPSRDLRRTPSRTTSDMCGRARENPRGKAWRGTLQPSVATIQYAVAWM